MSLLFVMIGGFSGSICRFAIGEWIHTQNGFPLATLLINLTGSFILGWYLTFVSRRKKIRPEFTLLFGTGFIGSFTTFSTFSVETIQLFQKGHFFIALLYVLSTTILGLLLAYLGCKLAILNRNKGETV
jgi:CrcB protein